MAGFAKVFSSLWQGSMFGDADAQLVFVLLLAHADASGVVDVAHELIAAMTGIPVDRVRSAVERLEAADPRSRTPDLDGRRIVRLNEWRDWGWQVVNYSAYRAARDEDMRRARAAERMRDSRIRRDASSKPCRPIPVPPPSMPVEGRPDPGAGEDAEGGEECLQVAMAAVCGVAEEPARPAKAKVKREWVEEFSDYFWPCYRRKVGKAAALRVWMRLPMTQEKLDEVMEGLRRWNHSHADDDVKFIPHPATWLTQERYLDSSM
jgi:hypothetical protein